MVNSFKYTLDNNRGEEVFYNRGANKCTFTRKHIKIKTYLFNLIKINKVCWYKVERMCTKWVARHPSEGTMGTDSHIFTIGYSGARKFVFAFNYEKQWRYGEKFFIKGQPFYEIKSPEETLVIQDVVKFMNQNGLRTMEQVLSTLCNLCY